MNITFYLQSEHQDIGKILILKENKKNYKNKEKQINWNYTWKKPKREDSK